MTNGAYHQAGNYTGVTVEKREGTRGGRDHFIDVPGIYSLTAYSLDEVVTRDIILEEKFALRPIDKISGVV